MKKKALLVNDSKFESLILRDMLSKLDFEVEIADEFDAIYEVEQFRPDIIIVNYIMQETTGDELIQQIKLGQPSAKCVLSSSNTVKLSDFNGKRIDGLLHTPISIFSLKDTLHRLGAVNLDDDLLKTSNTEASGRFCDSCNQDISTFSMNIVFCPFCGDELHDK
ncbi:MAG: hypothetical protein CVU84_05285 [Firmicutes bacterium HGW-Firmicutes-1]|jgi:CheY-like chemotaxis protein|nr:MAG: hypothetical protein CVU84_05285 [Firmicutes bacterium HGW-Firmicutes-1]